MPTDEQKQRARELADILFSIPPLAGGWRAKAEPRILKALQAAEERGKREAAERCAEIAEGYVFELAPGNSIRCGFSWAKKIRAEFKMEALEGCAGSVEER